VRPDGIVEGGSIGLTEGSIARQAIEEWSGALPLGDSAV